MCVADRCYTPLDDAGCTFTTAWTCDENADLSTADLSGCDLVNISFMGSALSAGPSGPATNFDGANLTGALFQTFAGRLTSFVGADLSGATFDSYLGGDANFTNAILDGTSFINGGSYVGADFSGTDVGSVTWGGSLTCPSNTSLGTSPAGTCCTKWAMGKAPAAGCV